MDNLERLIEKYKREMLGISKRSVYDEITTEVDSQKEKSENKEAEREEIKAPEIPVSENTDSSVMPLHYGFLKVAAFAGNEAFPVQTARVEVFDKEGNMLYSLLTNSGGIAEGMVLETPSETENDEPGGKIGYSVYKVKVSHPDYGTKEFDDVQIFEGIESIQQVFFQPDALSLADKEDSDG